MRIVFLCGSLEQGRDGVGDYTIRLAAELTKQGNSVAAIALNDHYIKEVTYGNQSEDLIDIKILRLPSSLYTKEKYAFAKSWIDSLNPDLLSLQYVPFSFHPKGLSLSLNRCLKEIGEDRLWHIMFHELWVGMSSDSTSKLVYWGKVQKWLIKSLVKTLKPIVVHTQTKIYQLQLEKMKIDAKYLPLFSNIPANCHNGQNLIKPDNSLSEMTNFVFVLFGGIYPGAPVRQFAEEVSNFGKKSNTNFILKIVGRSGAEQQIWETIWRSTGLIVESYGEQTVESVSAILKAASSGISTTPIAIVEKSGTAAAMKEHGLPVICVSAPWRARGVTELDAPSGIVQYEVGNLSNCLSTFKVPYNTDVSSVGRTFIDDLQLVMNNALLIKSSN